MFSQDRAVSQMQGGGDREDRQDRQPLTPEACTDHFVREAEMSCARLYPVKGKQDDPIIDLSSQFVHSTMVDESFYLVAAHVDDQTQQKIRQGLYVNFTKLLPRDQVLAEEEVKLQVVYKNGQTFWVPENDSATMTISNFNKWEQAFRVFSDIYCKAHPDRSWELVQYNHIIHTAAQTYQWENVYLYNKDFRIHLSNHPTRSWAIILQQSWTLCMKDKVRNGGFSGNNYHGHK